MCVRRKDIIHAVMPVCVRVCVSLERLVSVGDVGRADRLNRARSPVLAAAACLREAERADVAIPQLGPHQNTD